MPPMESRPTGVEIAGRQPSRFTWKAAAAGRFEGEVVTIAPTRIPVTVDIDGVVAPVHPRHRRQRDDGAVVGLRDLAPTAAPQLHGLPIATVTGPTTASVTRARTMTVGGRRRSTNAAVMTIGDQILDGDPERGPVTRSTACWAATSCASSWSPSTTRAGRCACSATRRPRSSTSSSASASSSAPASARTASRSASSTRAPTPQLKQLSVGDEIVSIDGQALDALDSRGGRRRCSAGPSAPRTRSRWERRGRAGLSNTTVDVLVDDLIPAP